MEAEVKPDDGAVAPETAADTSQDAALIDREEKSAPAPAAEPEGLSAETLKLLESLDPAKLPEALRRKIEAPFLSDYTRKTQTVADERRAIEEDRKQQNATLMSLVERLTKAQGAEVTVDQKAELLERIRNGETELVDKLIELKMAETIGPKIAHFSQKEAIEEAARLFPALPKYEVDVANQLKSNPMLLQLASMDNHRYAATILAGIGKSIHADRLAAELEEYKKGEPDRAKKAVDDWRAKVRSLPPSTSHAGTSGGKEGEEAPKDFKEAARRTAAEMGWQ